LVNAADIVLALYTDDELKKKSHAKIQLLKNRFGETIEEGADVLCLPEIYYLGDFKIDESAISTAQLINELITGVV
jgi:hypothetical protein